MSDGVITVDATGSLGTEGAQILATWFGPSRPGQKLWDYLAQRDAAVACRLETAWDAVMTGFLPLELALAQVHSILRVGTASYELRVEPIYDVTTPQRFLVVVRDVTLALERDAATADARELGAALQSIAINREGFVEQLREVDTIARRVIESTEPLPEVLRDLHTLKGNAAMMGFGSISAICHAWEECIDGTQELPVGELRSRLVTRWKAVRGSFAPLLHDGSHRSAVDRVDLDRLEEAIRAGRPRGVLLGLTRALTMDRAETQLARLAEYARISARTRGNELRVITSCEDVRLEGAELAPLWSALVHLVRNALSHGIEPAEERVAAGKPAVGELLLSCGQGPQGLDIVVSDDGRGIDWARVRTAAVAAGLPADGAHDLERALFAPGLTTSERVTELSGRGQGMAAVLGAVRAFDGTIRVRSKEGRGATWSISIPEGRHWLRRSGSGTYRAFDPCLLPAVGTS